MPAPNRKSNLRVLFVNDSEENLTLLRRAFKAARLPHRIISVNQTEEALRIVRSEADSFDVIVSGDRLSDMTGMDFYRETVKSKANKPFVLLTNYGEEHLAVVPFKTGLVDFIVRDSDSNFWNSLPAALDTLVREYNNHSALRKGDKDMSQEIHAFQESMDARQYPVISANENGLITVFNSAAEKLFGFSKSETVGLPLDILICDPYVDLVKDCFSEKAAGISSGDKLEVSAVRSGNKQIEIELTFSIGFTEDEEYIFAIVREISQHRLDLFASPGSRAGYISLMELTDDAVFMIVDGEFKIVNHGFMELFDLSREEICSPGFNLMDIATSRSKSDFTDNLKKIKVGRTEPHRFGFTAVSKIGREIEVEASMNSISVDERIAVQGIIRDVSEKKTLEAQLFQAQKMEAIGQLAGGVAHDFNNLLTVIIGNCELIYRKSRLSKQCAGYLEGIHRAANAASDLTRQLLAFSRKQTHEFQIVDLNDVIVDMDKMLRRIIGENIELKTIQYEEPCSVRIDRAQFGQVIVNLAVNARDAMPEGGSLTVELKKCSHVADTLEYAGTLKGNFVLLEVTDSGVGLTEDLMKKIFDPFFTTKKKGQGTGLGLTMVYGTVKQSGGYIKVESAPGKGTRFKVYLPLVDGEADYVDNCLLREDLPGGNETILLVEDDQQVREITENTLKLKGYRVISAKDGVEALEITDTMDNSINILLTDVVMPRMNGIELSEALKEKWENLKILFMSGYTNKDIIKPGFFTQETELIQKPFHTAALLRKVRAILDS